MAWLTSESVARKWKASTQNRWQAALSLIFRVAVDNEKIGRNVAAGIKRKTENNGRVRFLSRDEEKKLRTVIKNRFPEFLPHLVLSLNTGMRSGEQYGMRWKDVDFERRILTLPKTKNGTVRHIPLNSEAVAALRVVSTFSPLDGLMRGYRVQEDGSLSR